MIVDLHCHVLPGIDDGPATLEEAIALVGGARDDGISAIAATPHVSWSYPDVDSALIRTGVHELQDRLDAAGVRVQIMPGAEVASTRAADLDDAELRRLTLGDGPWMLLECPISPTDAPGFVSVASALAWRGHRLLLAHPERSPIFLRKPELVDELVAQGMLTQVTAGALSGRYGRTVRDFALRLIERELAHVVASDAHGRSRPARIAAELEAARVGPELAAWLSHDVPVALLAGRTLPPRPEGSPRRSRRRLLPSRRR